MPELTVTWNREYRQQDISEAWGCGGKEDCMPWQDLLGRDDGYLPKFIEMGGEIGYMYLPGIYYFSNTFCGKLPRTGLQT